jgi:hypothetical protein
MFRNATYPVVRLAHGVATKILAMTGKKKLSGAAIKAAFKENPNLEMIDAVTDQWLTLAEAKQAGAKQVNIRYNDDRDVCPITL